MNLFFAPLACSMATRIALYEAGANVDFTLVDTKTKKLADGSDFYAINPLGQVPVLRTDDGSLLTENTAILPFVADHFPQARLAPTSPSQRAHMQQWLGFIGTELHKAIFVPLLDPHAPADVKSYSHEKLPLRFDVLCRHLTSREFLLDDFSVADAYLFVVLNWARYTQVDFAPWPEVAAYYTRLSQRPSIAMALSEEVDIYQQQELMR
jgi:glutathione S-transferase